MPLGVLDGSDGTEAEKKVFDEWLRARWVEKDKMMLDFARDGRFGGWKVKGEQAEWPLALRHWWEYLECFSFFLPMMALVAAWYLLPSVWGAVVSTLGGGKAAEAVVKPCCAATTSTAAAKLASRKLVGEL